MCSELLEGPHRYHVWFTGHDRDCYWVCDECAARFPELPDGLIDITDVMYDRILRYAQWSGICGTPELKQRETSLRFLHHAATAPFSERLIDLQPDLTTQDKWFVLLASGDICRVDFRRQSIDTLYRLSDTGFEINDDTALIVSAKNDFAAIFQASAELACVFDLPTGNIVKRIDRTDHYVEECYFPLAFTELCGRTLLIFGCSTHRLDVCDPLTNELLTARDPTTYTAAGLKPPGQLDYYSQIVVSPHGNWIVQNGWGWHPVGIVRSWNLPDWVDRNPWESEDGKSLRELVCHDGFWDGPVCWIDDVTVAVWGLGHERWIIPAVHIFDVRNGREINWFAGPHPRYPELQESKKCAPGLFFDQYLFAAHDETGISVWDHVTGQRLLVDPSIAPIHYHPNSKEFLSKQDGRFVLSYLTGG